MRLLYKNLFDILLWRIVDGINLVASIRAALEARDIMFMKSEFSMCEYAISNWCNTVRFGKHTVMYGRKVVNLL